VKLAFIGIGALGGYFGGRLAKAGNDVVFFARGETLAALRRDGLRVESIAGDFSLPRVNATDNPHESGQVDAVFMTVKAWQVPDAALQIRSMVGPQTVVVPLQNGVDAYAQLAAALGDDHILGGLCHIIAFASAPGVVRHTGIKPLITIGEWRNTRTSRLSKLVECLTQAGIDARVPENIQVALWDKFMYIASFAGVGAVTRAPIGIVRSVPETRSLLERAMREAVCLARAHGIAVSDDSIAAALKLVDSLPPEGMASMQRDVAAGRPSELAALSGAVVRLGQQHGLSTPVHEFIYSSLLPSELRARGQVRF